MQATARFPGGKKVEVEVGGKTILMDQPAELGGEDSAPSPFALFLASIVGCAGFFALEFCHARGLPTHGLLVLMKGDRDPEKKVFDRLRIEIKVPEGFPERYREALRRAVDQCPVKKNIVENPQFEVVVV